MPKRKNNDPLPPPPKRRKVYNATSEKEKNVIGNSLFAARKKAGLTLAGLSRKLEAYGISQGPAGISKWETGRTVPTCYQLLALCDALGIENIRNELTSYPTLSLNEAGLEKLERYKEDLIASGEYAPEPPPLEWPGNILQINMPVCSDRISLKSDNTIDDKSFEMISFPASSIPTKAHFGVRISDDSMEPVYQNGQIVWIQKCEAINVNEDGYFFYKDHGYLKCYSEQMPEKQYKDDYTDAFGNVHHQPVLLSYNESYEPICISPLRPLILLGRVLKP